MTDNKGRVKMKNKERDELNTLIADHYGQQLIHLIVDTSQKRAEAALFELFRGIDGCLRTAVEGIDHAGILGPAENEQLRAIFAGAVHVRTGGGAGEHKAMEATIGQVVRFAAKQHALHAAQHSVNNRERRMGVGHSMAALQPEGREKSTT